MWRDVSGYMDIAHTGNYLTSFYLFLKEFSKKWKSKKKKKVEKINYLKKNEVQKISILHEQHIFSFKHLRSMNVIDFKYSV